MPIARETRREAEVLDDFAECLGHEHRRKILFSLHLDGGELVVPEDLLEGDADPGRFAIELAHHHLPKLVDSGYVSWDREAGVVREGDEFDTIEPLLEVLSEQYDHVVPGLY